MIFKTRKPKRNHHAPGFGPGFLFAKKGAKHRGRARRAAEAQSEARDAKRGGPPKRVRSTEGKHAAQRQRSPKPATRSGAGRQKGCEAPRTRTALKGLPQSEARDVKRGRPQKGCEAPRTRTALKGLPQSEARDAKRGGPPKRVRSTEGEHGPERATAVRSPRRKAGQAAKRVRSTEGEHAAQRKRSPKPATRRGAGRQKGCEARNPKGNGLLEGFLHSLSLKNKLRIDNGTLWI